MLENNSGKAIKPIEPGGWKITLAGLVDAIIAVIPIILLIIYRQPTIIYKWLANINSTLLTLIILVVIRFVFIMLFDRSIGMMIFSLIFLNHEEKRLNFIEKCLAGLFVLYRGVEYYEYQ
jgi:hypothetical protein